MGVRFVRSQLGPPIGLFIFGHLIVGWTTESRPASRAPSGEGCSLTKKNYVFLPINRVRPI